MSSNRPQLKHDPVGTGCRSYDLITRAVFRSPSLKRLRRLCLIVPVAIAVVALRPCAAKDHDEILKNHERSSVSLDLEFTSRYQTSFQRIISSFDRRPNAYATGFLVGPRLALTAYHVVSGQLDFGKRIALGFSRDEELEVKVYTKGCQARVLEVDKQADLALLEVCGLSPQTDPVLFQSNMAKDESILLIARPHGQKVIGHGIFFGSYTYNGIDYWSARFASRDGFSGSPIYNQQGELIGVFSAYDWSKNLALISPAARAETLIQNYKRNAKP